MLFAVLAAVLAAAAFAEGAESSNRKVLQFGGFGGGSLSQSQAQAQAQAQSRKYHQLSSATHQSRLSYQLCLCFALHSLYISQCQWLCLLVGLGLGSRACTVGWSTRGSQQHIIIAAVTCMCMCGLARSAKYGMVLVVFTHNPCLTRHCRRCCCCCCRCCLCLYVAVGGGFGGFGGGSLSQAQAQAQAQSQSFGEYHCTCCTTPRERVRQHSKHFHNTTLLPCQHRHLRPALLQSAPPPVFVYMPPLYSCEGIWH
jgi:hypothetical protein